MVDEHDRLEQQITGQAWVDCKGCAAEGHSKRILATTPGKVCQDHGGPPTNCRTCGTGSRWWVGNRCSNCGGDGRKGGSGDSDHRVRTRQRMTKMFGPKLEGDILLLDADEQQGREQYITFLEEHPEHEVARYWGPKVIAQQHKAAEKSSRPLWRRIFGGAT